MSKNNMNNQNKIMLDGMEKIEVNPLDQPIYLPSKSKMTTPREQVQATRDPMTIDYFKASFPEPTPEDFPKVAALDFNDIFKHFKSFEGIEHVTLKLFDTPFPPIDASMLGIELSEYDYATDIQRGNEWINEFVNIYPIEFPKVATGIPEFDQMLDGGFKRGALTVIGSQAGIGKTRLLRELGSSMINNGTMFVGSFSENLGDILAEFNDAADLPDQFEIVNGSCSLSTLIADLREVLDSIWAEVNEVPIVMVDDAMFYKDAGADTLANQLRAIAKEYNVAMVLTNPLSRQSHYSGDGVWLSSDSRLIASADSAITMTRADSTGWNKLKVVKNRDTGVLGQYTFFDPLSRAFSPF